MKITSSIHYCLLYLFTCIGLLQAEGFIAGTLIKTDSGYTKIELLEIGNNLISPRHNHTAEKCSITNITYCTIDYCIKIGIGDEYIYTAPDQKFYLYDQQKWITANLLKPTNLLMNCEGHSIHIDTVEIITEQCTTYLLSVEINHTLCVSSYDIIAHNSPTVVLHIFSYAAPIIAEVVQAGLAVGATLFGAHIAQKISKKHRHVITDTTNSSNANSGFDGGGGWQDPEDDDKFNTEKYPNGIYKDAKYHTINSKGPKSRCPKNGQKLLNKAFKIEDSIDEFIAIEGNYFVVFYKTTIREFHGHVRTWNELTPYMKNTLIHQGLVRRSGKIIREALKKYELL